MTENGARRVREILANILTLDIERLTPVPDSQLWHHTLSWQWTFITIYLGTGPCPTVFAKISRSPFQLLFSAVFLKCSRGFTSSLRNHGNHAVLLRLLGPTLPSLPRTHSLLGPWQHLWLPTGTGSWNGDAEHRPLYWGEMNWSQGLWAVHSETQHPCRLSQPK